MVRGVLILLVHMLIFVPLATLSIAVTIFWPRAEMLGRIAHFWSRFALAAAGVRLQVSGIDRLRQTRPAVVVANHTSGVDIFLFCRLLPIPFRMAAKRELFRVPVLGWAMAIAGFVPLERHGGRRDVERLRGLGEDFRRRVVIGFYPEGTRSQDGRLQPFKKGAFAVAIQQQIPVVPIALVGVHRIQRPGDWRARGGVVEVHVLEPTPTTGLVTADRDDLCARVRQAILDALPPDQRPADEPR